MENENTQYMSNEATQIDEKTVPVQDEDYPCHAG